MINILFGGNYKVFDGIALCLLSMTKYCKKELNIHILTADIQELNTDYKPINTEQVILLEKILKEANPNSKITLISLDQNFNKWISDSSNKLNQYTPYAFLRLFADKIENLPDKIIYLDTDIMLNGDISELFNINISHYEIGVVKDRYGRWFISPNYFNSGMLLMNMTKLKEHNIFEQVRDLCFKKKMKFPDQTALNKLCKEKLYLPRKFNEQGKLRENTIIQHFSKKIIWFPIFKTINVKQWQIDDIHKKYKIFVYDDIYEKFKQLKETM